MAKKGLERFLERMKPLIPEGEWEAFTQAITEPLDRSIRVRKDPGQAGMTDNCSLVTGNCTLTPVAGIPEAFLIDRTDRSTPLGKTLPHFNGDFYVQTLSSMLPVLALDPQPGEKILDMCAAPGSKSTFLGDLMDNTGVLICNEMSGSRIKKLVANLNRLGVLNACVTQLDGTRLPDWYGQEFDKILLDAPCSSEGHGRKDSKYFQTTWSEKAIQQSAKVQKRLIEAAFLVLKAGGEMVYSTCTMAPEENEEVVQFLIENYGDYLEIIPHGLSEELPVSPGLSERGDLMARIWPHKNTQTFSSEAFFLCKIRKTRGVPLPHPSRKGELHTDFTVLKKNEVSELLSRLQKTWGLPKSIFKPFVFLEKNGSLFFSTKDAVTFAKKNKVQRVGFKIMDEHQNLSSEFAITFGPLVNKNFIQLTEGQMKRWMEGYDLDAPLSVRGAAEGGGDSPEFLIRYGDYALGTGKIIPEREILKNRLDRNLLWR